MTIPHTELSAIELARHLAGLGQAEKALQAYAMVLGQEETAPQDRFEAACALFQYGEDYRVAYDAFLELYREGTLRADAFAILSDAFYAPNEQDFKKQYEKNCKLLGKYPYLFRKDFLDFEALPIRFYPYDDDRVVPFFVNEERFDPCVDYGEQVIRHHFFRDLEKPVLAKEIVSQYELEYLRDNVRRSDWVGRDNHIYLHYVDWNVFCAHLQHWDLKPLLEDEKFVFLIGEEIGLYPIDFKERFGLDYSACSVKPVGIREVQKIIWHTQLHCHNGGDLFDEVLHGHPNLLADCSTFFDNSIRIFRQILSGAEQLAKTRKKGQTGVSMSIMDKRVFCELADLKNRTLKDAMVAYYLGQNRYTRHLDPASRIVPAIVYQPHFGRMTFNWGIHPSGAIIPECSAYSQILDTGLLQQFRYIKAFTPMRRATTSHAATLRFMSARLNQSVAEALACTDMAQRQPTVITDVCFERILNRSFMMNSRDPLLHDSRVVRFEDGKLNSTATFTALAAFIDVPYTESMTYCSDETGTNPSHGSVTGFDPATVYRTYDEFADEYERKLIEYLWRDVYAYYGYDFHYYRCEEMTPEDVEKLLGQCHTNEELSHRSWYANRELLGQIHGLTGDALDQKITELADEAVKNQREARLLAVRILRHTSKFCDADGVLLRMMEPLQLDRALLDNELYH